MIIYEVNLAINSDIYSKFSAWLTDHVKDMLKIPGFLQASILKPENELLPNQEKLTVQYQLDNRASLERYFNEFAAKAREEGLRLFKDQFSAERRIYELQEHVTKS